MTTFHDFHSVLDRVFQAGGKVSVTNLAKDHGWGRARFVRVLDDLEHAGYVDMAITIQGAVKTYAPLATRHGIVALMNFNGESYETIVEYLINGKPCYKIDAPYHDYSGWIAFHPEPVKTQRILTVEETTI